MAELGVTIAGVAHENGSVESSHGHLKRAIADALLLWNYDSGLTELVGGVIEALTGKPLTDYADEVLFGPLNITD